MITVLATGYGFCLEKQGKTLLTPKKNPFVVPTLAIAEAIALELGDGKPYTPRNKPFTSIAYTAIDVVAPERSSMVEALLAYAETDLLCYRAENPQLRLMEEDQWQPVIEFIQHRYECRVEVTEGIMPLDQPAHTLERFRAALEAMEPMRLSAVSVLIQVYGSLLLALAVCEKGVDAKGAFALSRLDEDFQSSIWGVDPVSVQRAEHARKEVDAADMFLQML